MGNTLCIDMGNSFHFISAAFHEHVVERNLFCCTAACFCEIGFESPQEHVAIVSALWNQSQDWLQMEESLRARWAQRVAGSAPSSAPLSEAGFGGVAETHSRNSTATSELGQQEASRSIVQRISWGKSSICTNGRQLAEKIEADTGCSAQAERTAVAAKRVDSSRQEQPCLDRRLQRLVSHTRWPAGRTADCPRHVQPLFD